MQISVAYYAYYHLKRKKPPRVLHFGWNLQEGVDDLDFAVCCRGYYVSSDPTSLKMALIIFSSLEMLQVAIEWETQRVHKHLLQRET